MTIVSFVEISRIFGGVRIFGPATGIIRRGDRIGVVGPNGAGKTTFCKVLAGFDTPDEGQVHRDKLLRLHYMDQEPRFESEQSAVLDELLASCKDLKELERRIEDYQERLDSGERLEAEDLERYGDWLERFRRLDGWNLRARAEKILTGVGLGADTFSMPVNSLSGGQKSRLALAKALIAEPDLIFLDEPTNHLDLRAIEFLENFLLETSSSVVVISHDRAFLEKVTGKTIEILDSKVTVFNGNFSAFSKWAQAGAESAERTKKNYERKKEKIEDFIRRNIYGQKSRQAQSRRKMLARLKQPPQTRKVRNAPKWDINIDRQSGELVVEARGLTKAYPGQEPLFENMDLLLLREETLAVIGDNGTGKSTLLQILAGKQAPDRGSIEWGRDVSTAYLPQHVERPGDSRRILDYLACEAPELTLGQLRSFLARFLFTGEQVEQPVDSLSEGEFRRLLLAGLINSKANLLLLDEPTNHLDIYSRTALENAMDEYPGTVVLVSHDRKLLSRLADRVLEFNSPGRITGEGEKDKVIEYAGDYSYYKAQREKSERPAAEKIEKRPGEPSKEQQAGKPDAGRETGERVLSKNELRKLKERRVTLETTIAELEERKVRLQIELAYPETYKQEGRAVELAAGLESLTDRIDQAYEEWEELLEYD